MHTLCALLMRFSQRSFLASFILRKPQLNPSIARYERYEQIDKVATSDAPMGHKKFNGNIADRHRETAAVGRELVINAASSSSSSNGARCKFDGKRRQFQRPKDVQRTMCTVLKTLCTREFVCLTA